MVQESIGRRERNRLERHGGFLRAATSIVFSEGLDALTMARLAAELDCAVGTAYTYFPSKSALLAELQRAGIEALAASLERFDARFAAEVTALEADPVVADLARLVGFARFWIATFDTFPEEARLMQLLLGERGPSAAIADEDVSRVVPAALKLLDHARAAFDAAVASGALHAGDAMERTVVLAASLNGVLLLESLTRVDAQLFDGRRLAGGLIGDLLLAWGAPPDALAAALGHIDRLAATGPLAPRPDPEDR